jgi:cytochrome c-type biogenesis protein CcmE
MSRVDDELAQAIAESETDAQATEPGPVTRPVAPPPSRKRSVGLLVALLVMGGGILGLVFTNFQQAAVYSRGVDDLVSQKARLLGRNVRVEGTLVKGSLMRRDQPCEYRFSLEKHGVTLPVRYAQCIVPDTFRDVPGMDVSVTAEGALSAAGDFEATQIMAKCPSKYEMRDRANHGEVAPHGAMSPTTALRN